VIFYMLSGGVVIRREQIFDPVYASIFQKGEQYRLIHALLAKMICDRESRHQDMATVLLELRKISEWTQRARFPVLDRVQGAIELSGAPIWRPKRLNQTTRSGSAIEPSGQTLSLSFLSRG
jgi:hypothetical protein